MAEEYKNKSHEQEYKVGDEGGVESQDRGLFNFLGKKEEKKPQEEEVISTEFEKVKVSESDYQPHHVVPEEHKYDEEKKDDHYQPHHVVQEEHKDEEEKKHSLLEKLHRSGSSSSSSDEEEGEGEEKKKKKKEKKGLKEKIQEKISGEKEDETSIPVEKYEEGHVVAGEGCQPEEKKGFLDKIKEKLPGQHKTEEVSSPPPPQHNHQTSSEYAPTVAVSHHEGESEAKEKKGFLDKIKEKLPGYHSKTEEEKEKEKEKDKDSATHY